MYRTQDLHVKEIVRLSTPRELKALTPTSDAVNVTVARSRERIIRILRQEDPRLLVVIGPCSIHDEKSALEYAARLNALREQFADRLEIVMRVYFEKPRTTIGWKGLINDPHLDGSQDIETGLKIARRLLLEITAMGLPAATEFLDPIVPQYIADLISWTAVGARTTESQTHREMASGLSMPVGFKNRTDGDLRIAVNAIESARGAHSFIGIDQDGQTAIIRTTGNPLTHVVLRGGAKPNFDAASIGECEQLLLGAGLPARVMVDCSHAQTSKDYTRQPAVLRALIDQVRAGNSSIMGVMLESNIEAGNQKLSADRNALKYGVSITDPCIDWPTTERCILEAAELLTTHT